MNGLTGLPEEMRPRERLKREASADALSDEELLAVLLGHGVRGCDVLELAHRLRVALGAVWDNPEASIDWRSMVRYVDDYNQMHVDRPIRGFGNAKLLELAAAFALTRRMQRYWCENEWRSMNLRSSAAAAQVFERTVARRPEQETFFVLPMDSGFHPLCEPIAVTKGGVATVSVHPREVFCEAIRWRAHAVIVAHNHPSGDPTPSEQDIDLTDKLLAASKVVRIPVLDHLVLAGKDFISIRTLGLVSFA
ncbi:MAG: DNA repair protein RadC [Kiritimatiellae bacterium]|nr:DNA repair protein RadC [Kiritimatiellia bacterium]